MPELANENTEHPTKFEFQINSKMIEKKINLSPWVVHGYDHSTFVEAGEPGVQGQSQLHSKFKASLGYIQASLKRK